MGGSTQSPWQMLVFQSHAPFLSDTKSFFFTINTCQLVITSFRFQPIPIIRFKFQILIIPLGTQADEKEVHFPAFFSQLKSAVQVPPRVD